MENYANDHIEIIETSQTRGLLGYILRIFGGFLIFAIGFGLLFGIYLSIRMGSLYGFVEALIGGAIGALIFLLLVIPVDIYFKVRCYLKYRIINFDIIQERRLRVDQDFMSVFNAACEVLQSRKKVRILVKDGKRGFVEAERSSWGGVGEKITLKFMQGAGNNKVMITVSSKPKCFLTMMDASKNFENVELIIQGIRKRLGE
jgi:hypothetical protein